MTNIQYDVRYELCVQSIWTERGGAPSDSNSCNKQTKVILFAWKLSAYVLSALIETHSIAPET